MHPSIYIKILLFFVLFTGLGTYHSIVMKLQSRGIRLPLLDRFFILCFCVATPMTVVAFFQILFKPSLVVPTYTLADLPIWAYVAVFLLLLHGLTQGILTWFCGVKKLESVSGSASGSVQAYMRIHMRHLGENTYMGVGIDWSFRVRALMLYSLLGRNVKILFDIAGMVDRSGSRLQSANFISCVLFTAVSIVLKRGLPFIFWVSDLPSYVYGVSVVMLLVYAFIRFVLKFNYDMYALHALLSLKEMGEASDSEKVDYLLYYESKSPPAEVLLYDFFLRDHYMSILVEGCSE